MASSAPSSSLRYFTNPKDLTFASPIIVTRSPTLSTYTTIPKEKAVLEEFWNLVKQSPMVWDAERGERVQDVKWFTREYKDYVLKNGMTVGQFCLNYILRHHTKRAKSKKRDVSSPASPATSVTDATDAEEEDEDGMVSEEEEEGE